MKHFFRKLKKKITIVFIHNEDLKSLRLDLPLFLLLICFFAWTTLTLWAGFISGQHIDYLKVKADNKIMKMRMLFLSEQIKKSKEILAQIKQNDEHIRSLLAMDSKRIIIEDGLGYGGPTPIESSALSLILSGNTNSVSYQNIADRSFELLEEYKATIKSYNEIIDHINFQREKFRYTPSIWPCNGIVSSMFGFRLHPIFKNKFFHTGIDIAGKKGVSVNSTADGIVVFAGWRRGYGYVISVEHGYGYRTVYAHLAKMLVKKGEFVVKGQEIAKMGNTGRSTGPHLHYEVHYKNRPINPVKYLTGYFN